MQSQPMFCHPPHRPDFLGRGINDLHYCLLTPARAAIYGLFHSFHLHHHLSHNLDAAATAAAVPARCPALLGRWGQSSQGPRQSPPWWDRSPCPQRSVASSLQLHSTTIQLKHRHHAPEDGRRRLSARTSPQPPPSSATSLKAGATNAICSIIMGHKVASFLPFFPHPPSFLQL